MLNLAYNRRLITFLHGQTDDIFSLAFSPDGHTDHTLGKEDF
ncbi:MAG: hypothetical protein AB1801_21825 [Chloroflexota bacterium]